MQNMKITQLQAPVAYIVAELLLSLYGQLSNQPIIHFSITMEIPLHLRSLLAVNATAACAPHSHGHCRLRDGSRYITFLQCELHPYAHLSYLKIRIIICIVKSKTRVYSRRLLHVDYLGVSSSVSGIFTAVLRDSAGMLHCTKPAEASGRNLIVQDPKHDL